jgi:hypothetical protein
MEAQRNVVVVNEKGDKLNTEHLTWNALTKKIYTDKNLDEYRSANVDDFLNSIIKGTCITATCVEIIREKLIPKHIIFFYAIITPFLNVYHFMKKAFLRSMNFEE